MARAPRISIPDAIYHVTSRGNERRKTYAGEADYRIFLRLLDEVSIRYNVTIHAYCLMPNHYHLVLETPDANLSRAMQFLNGSYARFYNRTHDRIGHLFQGRFKAVLVERESHLMELIRYVVLNPVRSNLARSPSEWKWSSHLMMLGLSQPPSFLNTGWLLSCFDDDPSVARRAYAEFVQHGLYQKDRDFEKLKGEPAIGSSEFLERYVDIVRSASPQRHELPRTSRFADRPTLSSVLANIENRQDRNSKIMEAHLSHGYTMSEIARYLGINRTTVSRIIRSGKM